MRVQNEQYVRYESDVNQDGYVVDWEITWNISIGDLISISRVIRALVSRTKIKSTATVCDRLKKRRDTINSNSAQILIILLYALGVDTTKTITRAGVYAKNIKKCQQEGFVDTGGGRRRPSTSKAIAK